MFDVKQLKESHGQWIVLKKDFLRSIMIKPKKFYALDSFWKKKLIITILSVQLFSEISLVNIEIFQLARFTTSFSWKCSN